ncbi:Chondroitinase-AC [Pseudolycoriella hygida]|uniref:Chondroitinase-AC n=1 Tax=Pseudolycoriella hygida TaxID=35572 RepID=A0A9Q0NCV6_9DIPT|nr:Chondroitinase-AC [Pseudolycoriella hygida]
MKCFLVFLTLSIAGSFADDLQNDLEVIYERRLQELLSDNYNPPLAAQWRNQITKDGTWNDVDYTSGCPARRATWPAQQHWHRVITMASVWYYNRNDRLLLNKINLALIWWFDRDFTEPDCINAGGQDRHNCPCGTPGMWNTNWYGQMILIPGLVGNACLIMRTRLTDSQIESCRTILDRAYARIDGDPNGSMGPMTGANMLDVSSRGINLAIIANDTAILYDAISRYFNECQYSPGTYDGVKVDGSFMQHDAQIYNGNYGADFMRTMMLMFYQTKNTSFYPPQSVQEVYLTVINGSEWFMYRKNKEDDPLSPLVSWQYSVMGRMISHRYSDWNGIRLNLDTLLSATETWENHEKFQEIVGRLNSGSNVNPGGLIGTRFFPVSDYMVHRGLNYVVTLKMFSTRTTNSECNNDQNPFGFHLSDGVIYTYKNGHEYTDIYGAWNWYLTPGSTVDYGVNPLACNRVQFKGKESFVGGVAQGHAGVAVMNYTNPMSGSLGWLKSYFFLPNTYVVQYIGDIRSTSPTSPIYTTLDQRQLSGPVYIDGVLMNGTRVNTIARKVWHDRVGYEFVQPVNLTVDTSEHQANWPAIGISLGNETHSIFVAYVVHDLGPGSENRFDYFAHIDIELETFNNEFSSVRLRLERNLTESVDETVVRGVAYGEPGESGRYISLAFVTAGEFLIQQSDIAAVATDAPILLQFQYVSNDQRWKLAVADPSHKLNSVQITVNLTSSSDPIVLNVDLPSGNWAGGAATVEF